MNPKKIKKGMHVDYHSIIDGPITMKDCIVITEPFRPDGWQKKSGMVCVVDKIRGWVHCDALTEAKDESIAIKI